MKKARVLYVSQEINPYLPENHLSTTARHLPQGIQERGKEIRTFMPRYGCINERRHQLHEVIRLSGMNLIVNDTDHPLIIKVASIQPARMQVYFIDNEEYFQRKTVVADNDGKWHPDNDERSIFFCRGVLETVKKLGWAPDIIHCHGWMTGVMPLYLKKIFNDDPLFADSKVIYSVYDNGFDGTMDPNWSNKIMFDGVDAKDVELLKNPTFENLTKLAIEYSDALVIGSPNISDETRKALEAAGKPILEYQEGEGYIDAYSEFYDEVLEETTILAN